MIDRQEIDAHAADMRVNVANVQRDYVFGWILAGLYNGNPLSEDLVLKGGNSFRKAYFPLARFSNDLDFSCSRRMSTGELRDGLVQIAGYARDHAGIDFDEGKTLVTEGHSIDADRTAIKAKLYFRDFYGKPCEILISARIDITELDRMHLPVNTRPLIHQYSDAAACSATLRCWQLEEMLGAKLKCLVQRQHLVDLFDLVHSVFVNQDIEVNRAQVASVFLKKTIFGRSPGAAKTLLLQLPLEFARTSWKKYIVCPLQSAFGFDFAEQRLRELVNALFEQVTPSRGELAFFPPALRTSIMDAGRDKTLMRLTYDGSMRLIEPYALNYKVRLDGVGQEYLYAYDRTGGSSGPAMKTFLHGKIQSLEKLDEVFEPRFEIELGKVGEYPDQLTFSDPNRPLKPKTGKSRRVGTGARNYTVACPYCGKKFHRVGPTTRLNPHKNTWGSKCAGRTGYLV